MDLKFLVRKIEMDSMADLFLNHEPQLSVLFDKLMSELPDIMSQTTLTDRELFDLAMVLADKGIFTFAYSSISL